MPIDQAHKQNNEFVKGSGGAVGVTENPTAFRKWMIAGPEEARLLKEFEREFIVKETKEYYHHEEGFCTHLFLDDTPELVVLDTQNVVNESVVSTVRTVEAIGRDQCNIPQISDCRAHAQYMIR